MKTIEPSIAAATTTDDELAPFRKLPAVDEISNLVANCSILDDTYTFVLDKYPCDLTLQTFFSAKDSIKQPLHTYVAWRSSANRCSVSCHVTKACHVVTLRPCLNYDTRKNSQQLLPSLSKRDEAIYD